MAKTLTKPWATPTTGSCPFGVELRDRILQALDDHPQEYRRGLLRPQRSQFETLIPYRPLKESQEWRLEVSGMNKGGKSRRGLDEPQASGRDALIVGRTTTAASTATIPISAVRGIAATSLTRIGHTTPSTDLSPPPPTSQISVMKPLSFDRPNTSQDSGWH